MPCLIFCRCRVHLWRAPWPRPGCCSRRGRSHLLMTSFMTSDSSGSDAEMFRKFSDVYAHSVVPSPWPRGTRPRVTGYFGMLLLYTGAGSPIRQSMDELSVTLMSTMSGRGDGDYGQHWSEQDCEKHCEKRAGTLKH